MLAATMSRQLARCTPGLLKLVQPSLSVVQTAGPRAFISTSRTMREIFNVQDEDDFKAKVLDNPEPVVVDFKASWCGPCKILTPRLDAAIASTEGKVHLAIVDIDELSDLAIDHGVEAVPTVMAFKGGEMRDKFVGLLDEDKLDSFVKQLYDK